MKTGEKFERKFPDVINMHIYREICIRFKKH